MEEAFLPKSRRCQSHNARSGAELQDPLSAQIKSAMVSLEEMGQDEGRVPNNDRFGPLKILADSDLLDLAVAAAVLRRDVDLDAALEHSRPLVERLRRLRHRGRGSGDAGGLGGGADGEEEYGGDRGGRGASQERASVQTGSGAPLPCSQCPCVARFFLPLLSPVPHSFFLTKCSAAVQFS